MLVLAPAVRTLLRFRGKRYVTCPETGKPAAVEVDAAHAAATSLRHATDLRLSQCSRWPEREDCPQDCLKQIETDPEGCLAFNILSRRYENEVCVFCRRPFREIHWHDHRPAFLNPKGITVEWKDIPPEKLLEVLSTHWPVCWDCHVAETFRRMYPDRVIDRPWREDGPAGLRPGYLDRSQSEHREEKKEAAAL